MPHLPQTGKPGQIPQPIQMATHHTTQRPSVQSIQAMQNQQLPMQQVSYPGMLLMVFNRMDIYGGNYFGEIVKFPSFSGYCLSF